MDTARRIAHSIATQISARPEQVTSAVTLLDEGSTVPFIARYRKEATGGGTTASSACWLSGWATCASLMRGVR